jgi:hypothetical protein
LKTIARPRIARARRKFHYWLAAQRKMNPPRAARGRQLKGFPP